MQPTNQRPKPRLLIVDDDSFNLELLSRIFQRNCHVDTATNGKQALEMLVSDDYNVVLLDIMMPALNGLDVLKIIRSSTDISELPVVLISAISDKADVARGIRLGANDYITKPIDVDTVQARINTQVMLHQMTLEREKMIVRLQSANEMKSRMMSVASHDLRNPLTNLKMLMTIIEKQADGNPKLLKMIGMAEDSIEAMLNVVQDFLDSSAARSTEVHVNVRPIEGGSIVKQVLNQYAIAAHKKDIDLVAEHIGGTIMADPNRLAQVTGNLISNAIKYSPRNTTVTVRTDVDDAQAIWRLSILDEGPGIPEKEHEFLFQPFSKTKISTQPTANEESTGLGLWIVREMMQLQDGRVGLDTPAEGGCCFWIELPLAATTATV